MNQDILNDLDDLDNSEHSGQMSQQHHNQLNENQQNIMIIQHSNLLKNQQFLSHMKIIEQLVNKKIQTKNLQTNKIQQQYIHKSNHYASQIDYQIQGIIKFIKNIYNKKLPQLESIITNSIQYCKALLDIQINQNQKIFKYLSSHQSISLKIAISSPHDNLSEKDQEKVINNANIVTLLHQHHNLLMIYLQSCMQAIAPNLCQLVGSSIASKLISAAGGINKLAMMPACNIQVMGGNRSSQIGLSLLERNHTGIFGQMDIVRDSPRKFQIQLVRMLANNTAKCARADYLKSTNIQGSKLRDQMLQRFEKIQQQGGLLRLQKPLPIPDQQPKKKRGGKRYRKNKQLYQMSQLRKNQNRMKFGQQQQQQIGDGVGLGLLKNGIGKLKVNIKKQKINISKKMQERVNKKSGLESSLNLSAQQGIELINPALILQKKQGTQSYFSREAGFRTVLNNKLGK